jgi:hypothetical protein
MPVNQALWEHVRETLKVNAANTDYGKAIASSAAGTLTEDETKRALADGMAQYAFLMTQTVVRLLDQIAEAELTNS